MVETDKVSVVGELGSSWRFCARWEAGDSACGTVSMAVRPLSVSLEDVAFYVVDSA